MRVWSLGVSCTLVSAWASAGVQYVCWMNEWVREKGNSPGRNQASSHPYGTFLLSIGPPPPAPVELPLWTVGLSWCSFTSWVNHACRIATTMGPCVRMLDKYCELSLYFSVNAGSASSHISKGISWKWSLWIYRSLLSYNMAWLSLINVCYFRRWQSH